MEVKKKKKGLESWIICDFGRNKLIVTITLAKTSFRIILFLIFIFAHSIKLFELKFLIFYLYLKAWRIDIRVRGIETLLQRMIQFPMPY